MKFEDIQKMWAEDNAIDKENLDKEALKIPNLFSKYLDILSLKKFQLETIDSEIRKTKRLRYLYYRGALDQRELEERNWEPWQLSLSKNTDIQNCIDGDEIIETLVRKRAYLKMQVEYLENITKMISNRSFQIRDAISWTKFVNGM